MFRALGHTLSLNRSGHRRKPEDTLAAAFRLSLSLECSQ
ncbi:hypothetical protein ATPR_2098 [Acetobacter tropicalis NBRC 101654]|uniref:Uncharacterized protein n=1 Tax=Acetobacter tropicalis NBRC 101654 TaxID=749388 RepID=F7VFE9_9PROT|nr:hypothetical protein ATPR_2098 [Acetobacter tropicalis NBRC 101654]